MRDQADRPTLAMIECDNWYCKDELPTESEIENEINRLKALRIHHFNHWIIEADEEEIKKAGSGHLLMKSCSDILDEPLNFLTDCEQLEEEKRTIQIYSPHLFEWSQFYAESSPVYLICLIKDIIDKEETLLFTISQTTNAFEGIISSRKLSDSRLVFE